MKILISAVAVAVLLLIGAGVAYAAGPDYLIGIPVKWWVLLLLIAVIVNFVLWWKK